MVRRPTFDVLTTEDTGMWMEVLQEARHYDIYHLPQFHRLPEIRGEGKSLLLVYRDDGGMIALPIVLREIDLPEGISSGPLRDITSVGGFAGPVSSSMEITTETRLRFQSALGEFFATENVITAYQRLNPIIGNWRPFEGIGETVDLGVTVAVNLSLPVDQQFARYEHGHRADVNKLRRLGATCEEVGVECLDEFIEAYHETMRRAGATPVYFFDRPYFEYLLEEFPGITHLFVCRLDGETISATICSRVDGILQAMYGGIRDKYLRLSPLKLIYTCVREWATEAGAHWMSLGGSGGGVRDSQHYFRMGFGGIEFPYKLWRHVVDPKAYEEICAELSRRFGRQPSGSYFPAYRDPAIAPVVEAAK